MDEFNVKWELLKYELDILAIRDTLPLSVVFHGLQVLFKLAT